MAGLEDGSVNQVEDIIAQIVKFFLNLLLEFLNKVCMTATLAFFFLFNGFKSSPGSSSRTNGVFVGDGKEVSFFNSELLSLSDDLFHIVEHVFETFSLFGDLGHVNEFFSGEGHDIRCF